MRFLDPRYLATLALSVPVSCFSPDLSEGGASTEGGTSPEESSAETGTAPSPTTSDGPGGNPDGGSTGEGSTGGTMGPADTTSPPQGCQDDSDCSDVRAPFCSQGECVSCSALPDPDAGCANAFPETPYCEGSLCVGCTEDSQCGADAPICDPVEQACTGCKYHEQCPESACDVFDGNCLPANAVWWIDFDCSSGSGGVGSEASPFCTFEEALGAVPPGGEGTFFLASAVASTETLFVDAERTIAVISPGGQTLSNDYQNPATRVRIEDATLYLQGIHIMGGDPVNIDAGAGGRVGLDRCVIRQGSGPNVRMSSAQLLLRTSMLTTSGFSNGVGVGIAAIGSQIDILYSSIVRNNPTINGSAPDAIVCDVATTGTLRNSIVFEDGPPPLVALDCPGLEVSYSAVNEFIAGAGNVQIDIALDYGIFQNLANDFRLVPNGPGIELFDGVAEWQYGDPTTDYDGDLRPTSPGPDFAGIDIPAQ